MIRDMNDDYDYDDYDNGPVNGVCAADDPSTDCDDFTSPPELESLDSLSSLLETTYYVPSKAVHVINKVQYEHSFNDPERIHPKDWIVEGAIAHNSTYEINGIGNELEQLLEKASIPYVRINDFEKYEDETDLDNNNIDYLSQYKIFQPQSENTPALLIEKTMDHCITSNEYSDTLNKIDYTIDFEAWNKKLNPESIMVGLALVGIH